MYDATGYQVQYDAPQRRIAWVNEHGWMFSPPPTRTPIRETVAQALLALAARLAPTIPVPQPHTA